MDRLQVDREESKRRTYSLPLATGGEVVDEATSQAIYEDLVQSGSVIPKQLTEQVGEIEQEITYEFGPMLPPGVLHSIIALSVRRGAAQALNNTGESARQLEHLRDILGVEAVVLPTTKEPPAA